MKREFSPNALRVLGCLAEKELATPEYYPLTLNALLNACNQKSNREPVLNLSEDEVLTAIGELRSGQLVYLSAEGVRAARYCHNLGGRLKLEQEEQALLTVLLLRGPQTVGELRTRTERLSAFADLGAVEAVLQGLQEREEPLVTRLPRQPGRKEHRYAQLLGGDPSVEDGPEAVAAGHEPPPVAGDRLARLETEVAELREELNLLRSELAGFRSQFE